MFKTVLEVPKGLHKESTDICYVTGTFVELTKCEDCEVIQDYWSNNSRVCEYCGGIIKKFGVGKWDHSSNKWLKRE